MPGFHRKLLMFRYVNVALTPKFAMTSRSTPNMSSFVRGALRSAFTRLGDDAWLGFERLVLRDPWTPSAKMISFNFATPSHPFAPIVTHGWPLVCRSMAL